MLANSGEEANVDNSSTASINGLAASAHFSLFCSVNSLSNALIALTRAAVLLATSLALCTKCLFATGLVVLDEARRQALHNDDVCLATTVAADKT